MPCKRCNGAFIPVVERNGKLVCPCRLYETGMTRARGVASEVLATGAPSPSNSED